MFLVGIATGLMLLFSVLLLTRVQPSYFDQRLQPRGVVATPWNPLDFGLSDRIFL